MNACIIVGDSNVIFPTALVNGHVAILWTPRPRPGFRMCPGK